MYQLIFSVYRAGVECVSCFILSSAFFLVVDEHKLLEGNFAWFYFSKVRNSSLLLKPVGLLRELGKINALCSLPLRWCYAVEGMQQRNKSPDDCRLRAKGICDSIPLLIHVCSSIHLHLNLVFFCWRWVFKIISLLFFLSTLKPFWEEDLSV